MYVMCGMKVPVYLHINIFFTFQLQKIKACELSPHRDYCLNSLMALGKLLATIVHSIDINRGEQVNGYARDICCSVSVFASWKVEMVIKSIISAINFYFVCYVIDNKHSVLVFTI